MRANRSKMASSTLPGWVLGEQLTARNPAPRLCYMNGSSIYKYVGCRRWHSVCRNRNTQPHYFKCSAAGLAKHVQRVVSGVALDNPSPCTPLPYPCHTCGSHLYAVHLLIHTSAMSVWCELSAPYSPVAYLPKAKGGGTSMVHDHPPTTSSEN